jgi:tRNA G18 (ribose-2'-O)-methylase SpoU
MYKIAILENIRSAYNVGNIIRTADALGREVWMTGYTPTPDDTSRVGKSAL